MKAKRRRFVSEYENNTDIDFISEELNASVLYSQRKDKCLIGLYVDHDKKMLGTEIIEQQNDDYNNVIQISNFYRGNTLETYKNKDGIINRYVFKNRDGRISTILDERGRVVFSLLHPRSFIANGESEKYVEHFAKSVKYAEDRTIVTYISKEGHVIKHTMPSEDDTIFKCFKNVLKYLSTSEYIFGVSNRLQNELAWSYDEILDVFVYSHPGSYYDINIEIHNSEKKENIFDKDYIRCYENQDGIMVEFSASYELQGEGVHNGEVWKFIFKDENEFKVTITKADGTFHIRHIKDGFEIARYIRNGEVLGGFMLGKDEGLVEDVYMYHNEEGIVGFKNMREKHHAAEWCNIDSVNTFIRLSMLLDPMKIDVRKCEYVDLLKFDIYDHIGVEVSHFLTTDAKMYIYDKVAKSLGNVVYQEDEKNGDLLGIKKDVFNHVNSEIYELTCCGKYPIKVDEHGETCKHIIGDTKETLSFSIAALRHVQGKHTEENGLVGLFDIFGNKPSGISFDILFKQRYDTKSGSITVTRKFNITVFIALADTMDSNKYILLGSSGGNYFFYIEKELRLMSTEYVTEEDMKYGTYHKLYDYSFMPHDYMSDNKDDIMALSHLFKNIDVSIPLKKKGGE